MRSNWINGVKPVLINQTQEVKQFIDTINKPYMDAPFGTESIIDSDGGFSFIPFYAIYIPQNKHHDKIWYGIVTYTNKHHDVTGYRVLSRHTSEILYSYDTAEEMMNDQALLEFEHSMGNL